MLDNINPLTINEIEVLKKDFEVLVFPNDFDLVYENQIPCAGIALIEGSIEIIKNSKTLQTINQGNILGIYQLLNERPVQYGCRVKAKSKVILLGKSEILKLNQYRNLKNNPAIKQIKNL